MDYSLVVGYTVGLWRSKQGWHSVAGVVCPSSVSVDGQTEGHTSLAKECAWTGRDHGNGAVDLA